MNETPKHSKRYLKLSFFIFLFCLFVFSYPLVSIERETVGRPKICGSRYYNQILETYASFPGQASNRAINLPQFISLLTFLTLRNTYSGEFLPFVGSSQFYFITGSSVMCKETLQTRSKQDQEYTKVIF